MSPMKPLFYVFLVLFSLKAYSQQLGCCKSTDDVKKRIQGDWKLKDGNQNIIYRFIFDEDLGRIEVLEELNLPPKAEKPSNDILFLDAETKVRINLKEGIFYVNFIYPYATVSEVIIELNETTFSYGKGTSKKIFLRDKIK